jgi:hypothetical protein
MISSMMVSRAPVLLGVCCLAACLQIRPPPTPALAGVRAARQAQTRTLAIPVQAVFPRALDVLLDAGYLVRSANRELGLVAVYQQWHDDSQFERPTFTNEGSLLFQPDGPSKTRVRALIRRTWSSGGAGHTHLVETDVDPDAYKQILDVLENGLRPEASNGAPAPPP